MRRETGFRWRAKEQYKKYLGKSHRHLPTLHEHRLKCGLLLMEFLYKEDNRKPGKGLVCVIILLHKNCAFLAIWEVKEDI
jgi:hypothetical protein